MAKTKKVSRNIIMQNIDIDLAKELDKIKDIEGIATDSKMITKLILDYLPLKEKFKKKNDEFYSVNTQLNDLRYALNEVKEAKESLYKLI